MTNVYTTVVWQPQGKKQQDNSKQNPQCANGGLKHQTNY